MLKSRRVCWLLLFLLLSPLYLSGWVLLGLGTLHDERVQRSRFLRCRSNCRCCSEMVGSSFGGLYS